MYQVASIIFEASNSKSYIEKYKSMWFLFLSDIHQYHISLDNFYEKEIIWQIVLIVEKLLFLTIWLFNFLILPYPIVMEYAPEGELFYQVVKESEEETLMNKVTAKLRFYQISISYINEKCYRRKIIWQGGEGVRERANDERGQFEAKS